MAVLVVTFFNCQSSSPLKSCTFSEWKRFFSIRPISTRTTSSGQPTQNFNVRMISGTLSGAARRDCTAVLAGPLKRLYRRARFTLPVNLHGCVELKKGWKMAAILLVTQRNWVDLERFAMQWMSSSYQVMFVTFGFERQAEQKNLPFLKDLINVDSFDSCTSS